MQSASGQQSVCQGQGCSFGTLPTVPCCVLSMRHCMWCCGYDTCICTPQLLTGFTTSSHSLLAESLNWPSMSSFTVGCKRRRMQQQLASVACTLHARH